MYYRPEWHWPLASETVPAFSSFVLRFLWKSMKNMIFLGFWVVAYVFSKAAWLQRTTSHKQCKRPTRSSRKTTHPAAWQVDHSMNMHVAIHMHVTGWFVLCSLVVLWNLSPSPCRPWAESAHATTHEYSSLACRPSPSTFLYSCHNKQDPNAGNDHVAECYQNTISDTFAQQCNTPMAPIDSQFMTSY